MKPPSTGRGVVIGASLLAFAVVAIYATGLATLVVGGVVITLAAIVVYYAAVNVDRLLREVL